MKKASIHTFLKLLPVALTVVLSGCSSKSDDLPPPEAADVLYQRGRDAFDVKKYKKAVEAFDELERQHPNSDLTPKAQILVGYAHYQAQEYDDAILAFERFTKLHPGHDSIAYAYYMIALCYYEQISDVGRDQGMTEKALQGLRDVVGRFPDTEFARDAQLKMDLTEDHLAGKEMMVGRWYQGQGQDLAAVNRFKMVVDKFQTTSHVPEALHRLVETYMRLGVVDEAKRYAAVLGHNFPDSKWYRYSYDLMGSALPAGAAVPVDAPEPEKKDEKSSPVPELSKPAQ
jgi:outer membrane protein assembly factor BamD